MKTRIDGQYIRLRLAQEEVESLVAGEMLEQWLQFGTTRFGIALGPVVEQQEVKLNEETVFIGLPTTWLEEWDSNQIVGFDFEVSFLEGPALRIVVEKDFPCVHTADGRKAFGNAVKMT